MTIETRRLTKKETADRNQEKADLQVVYNLRTAEDMADRVAMERYANAMGSAGITWDELPEGMVGNNYQENNK